MFSTNPTFPVLPRLVHSAIPLSLWRDSDMSHKDHRKGGDILQVFTLIYVLIRDIGKYLNMLLLCLQDDVAFFSYPFSFEAFFRREDETEGEFAL